MSRCACCLQSLAQDASPRETSSCAARTRQSVAARAPTNCTSRRALLLATYSPQHSATPRCGNMQKSSTPAASWAASHLRSHTRLRTHRSAPARATALGSTSRCSKHASSLQHCCSAQSGSSPRRTCTHRCSSSQCRPSTACRCVFDAAQKRRRVRSFDVAVERIILSMRTTIPR